MMVIFILALKKLRNSNDVEEDIEEMRAEEVAQRAEAKITMWELIQSPTLRSVRTYTFYLIIITIIQVQSILSDKPKLHNFVQIRPSGCLW